jgi:DNA-directed RNA polymerase specialized sigma24 family protein
LLSEIADRTKESLANVRHHYYRGLPRLKKFMEAQPGSAEQPRKLSQEGNDVES